MGKILFSGFMLLLASPVFAGVLTAELDKTVGPIDEPFVVTFTVSGDHDGEPQLPDIRDLKITGAGTSSSFTMFNGKTSKSTEYRFFVQALKEGNYAIPSIEMKVDGKMQKTLPLKFRVEPAGTAADGGPPVAFIKRELSANEVYIGEPIVAKVKIYFREKLAQAQNASEQSTDFRVFKSENQKDYTEEVNGVPYRVHELTEILVPTKTGNLTLNPYILETQVIERSSRRRQRRGNPGSLFDDFFGGGLGGGRFKRKVLRAEAESIKVLPVPEKGKPKDFSGLVGSFQIDANLAADSVKTGETVTLTVTVRGRGLVDQLESVRLDLPNEMKVYTDKPISEQAIDDEQGFLSRKVFKYALVPTAPGSYELPPVTLRVFVPKLGTYVELSADLPQLTVTGEEESIGVAGKTQPRQKRVKKLAEDLINIHRGNRLIKTHRIGQQDFVWLGLLSGLPGLALFFGLVWRRQKTKVDPEAVQMRRRSQAFRQFSASLKNASSSNEMFTAFRLYLGDLLGVKGGAVTEKDAVVRLSQKGVDEDTLAKLKSQWSTLARAEYGGVAFSAEDVERLKGDIQLLAKEIDQQC